MYIPCLTVILLLIREIYHTVSISIGTLQRKALWCSLAALSELLAVFSFAASGLVSEKKSSVPDARGNERDSGTVRST